MRSSVTVKATHRLLLRKTSTSASAAARRNFPAWLDASEGPVAIEITRRAKPRVRDGLVLHAVKKRKAAERSYHHASGDR